MARKHKLERRIGLFEALEQRSLMAADVMSLSLPYNWDTADLDTLPSNVYTLVPAPADPFLAKINASIDRMAVESPNSLPAYVRALQGLSARPDLYGNEAALDELYSQYLNNPELDQLPADLSSDSDSSFLERVNAKIAQMGIEAPANQPAFIWALQTAMLASAEFNDIALNQLYNQVLADSQPTLSIDAINTSILTMGTESPENQPAFVTALQLDTPTTEEELDLLYKQYSQPPQVVSETGELVALINYPYANIDSEFLPTTTGETSTPPSATQTSKPSWPMTESSLSSIQINSKWEVGEYNSGFDSTYWFRASGDDTWTQVQLPNDPGRAVAMRLQGDKLVLRFEVNDQATVLKFNRLDVTIDLTLRSVVDQQSLLVNPNYINSSASNDAWIIVADEFGATFGTSRPASGRFKLEAADWLPADLDVIRIEATANPDVFLLQGMTKGAVLEYRTVTVDLSQRQTIDDEVTDAEGVGFVARKTRLGFQVRWTMEGDWRFDSTKHLMWPQVRLQQSNDQWVVQAAASTIYYKQAGTDQWHEALGLSSDHVFYADHFVIEGDQLIGYGRDLAVPGTGTARLIIDLSTGKAGQIEPVAPEDVQPTNLTMETFPNGMPPDRRTPSQPIPMENYEIPLVVISAPASEASESSAAIGEAPAVPSVQLAVAAPAVVTSRELPATNAESEMQEFEISNLKPEISNFKSQISNFKLETSNHSADAIPMSDDSPESSLPGPRKSLRIKKA